MHDYTSSGHMLKSSIFRKECLCQLKLVVNNTNGNGGIQNVSHRGIYFVLIYHYKWVIKFYQVAYLLWS